MRHLKTILFMSLIVFMAQYVRANGGPVDDYWTSKTGQHVFKNIGSISLKSEKLVIKILGEYTEYNVEYEFINKGKANKVDYAFPVAYDGEDKPEIAQKVLLSFQMMDSGTEIPCKLSKEKVESNNEWGSRILLWNRAIVDFKENERKLLTIKYKVKSKSEDYGTSKNFLYDYSSRTTNYSFGAAKYWGDGKAGSLDISIDCGALESKGGRIINIEPAKFNKNRNIYTLSYKNLDMGSVPDIIITYDNTNEVMWDFIKKYQVPRNAIKSIKASSTLKNGLSGVKQYSAENMIDGSIQTAWAEGEKGKGSGNIIEVEVEGYHIEAVGIVNGYTKNEATYKENGKVKSIHVRDNITDKLAKHKFSEYDGGLNVSGIDWVYDKPDYSEGHGESGVNLVIVDAEPGSKYKDTAISEIYLLGTKESGK